MQGENLKLAVTHNVHHYSLYLEVLKIKTMHILNHFTALVSDVCDHFPRGSV